jgi:uncharacterized repeat protein (TIGR03803 family)
MRGSSEIGNTLAWRSRAVIAIVMNVLAGFATSANAATETVLHSFGSGGDGYSPYASLINVKGTLYGTTEYGGTGNCPHGCGTVFTITPGGTETVLYSFQGGSDGRYPYASLINVKGTLYGTTKEGGPYLAGTVFSITPGGTETVLYTFQADGTDGVFPYAGLINVKGTLYGTTYGGGGESGGGIVFSITPGGAETTLYSFQGGSDGVFPYASLINVKGTLYGTTYAGGGDFSGGGIVFSITPSGAETVLHSFGNGGDGAEPYADLVNVKGTLYGTTEYGGANGPPQGVGTIFSITPGGMETVIYSFRDNGADGTIPYAGLINVKGTLFGTTNQGGANGVGTVFTANPDGAEKVLHSFGNSGDGAYPYAGLINVKGTLFGTTSQGGANGLGTVFSITP